MLSWILFLVFVPLAVWVCSVDEKHFDRQSGELHSTLNDACTDTVQLQSDIFDLVLSSSTLSVLCIVRKGFDIHFSSLGFGPGVAAEPCASCCNASHA